PSLAVPGQTGQARPPKVPVRIWKADTMGSDEGDEAALWLSEFLQTPCRLLKEHPEAVRPASAEYVEPWILKNSEWAHDFPAVHDFGFADGFPFLVVNQASLDELNGQLQERGVQPVPMSRFRPNIVVQGMEPYEEDHLAGMVIQG